MTTQPTIRPADVVVALAVVDEPGQTLAQLSERLRLSVGAVHGAARRLGDALLLMPGTRLPNKPNLKEFLLFGVQYAFYPVLGPDARGVPTAYSGPVMRDAFSAGDEIVWPSSKGKVRGRTLVPLYPGAPLLQDGYPTVYAALTVIDSLRIGQLREREQARDWLATFVGG
jgi:hypothetical protein